MHGRTACTFFEVESLSPVPHDVYRSPNNESTLDVSLYAPPVEAEAPEHRAAAAKPLKSTAYRRLDSRRRYATWGSVALSYTLFLGGSSLLFPSLKTFGISHACGIAMIFTFLFLCFVVSAVSCWVSRLRVVAFAINASCLLWISFQTCVILLVLLVFSF